MADALPLPPLRDVIRRHGLAARKSLGQNFLLDLNLTRRIARSAAPLAGFNVIEIGPGPGGLTRALLLEGARRVVAVERDGRCLPALAELEAIFPGRLEVVPGDALKIDPATLTPAPRKIVANLPYNIATPLLVAWLPRLGEFADYTLMFQKEVALRLAAKPGTSAYGRLSVLTQWLAYVERLFDVTPKAFVPPPNVTSTVVRLKPRSEPQAPCDRDALERVTAAAFGQRRKMLRQSLKPLGDASRLLHDAMVDPTARAEDLTVSEFCALARTLMTASI